MDNSITITLTKEELHAIVCLHDIIIEEVDWKQLWPSREERIEEAMEVLLKLFKQDELS